MSSPKSSFLQPLLEISPVQLYQCQYSYPSVPPVIQKARDYLQEHLANHVPLDKELPYLRDSLQGTLMEIDRWDSELAKLQDVVRQMGERRKCLSEVAFRLGGMVRTTIRKLPSELLSRIFFMARDDNEGWLPCEVPLTLSHVCSRWRALVHSEPGLWCIISAKFYEEDDQASADRVLEFTKFCLEKSQSRPLNVALTAPEYRYEWNHEEEKEILVLEYEKGLHAEVLDELLLHGNRWQFAYFLLHPYDEEQFDHNMDFPILERLVMYFEAEYSSNAITPTFSAPRLSHMHLRGVDFTGRLINLDALTELTMEDYDADGFLRILQHSPNLSDVTLKGSESAFHQVSNLHVVPQIKSLVMRYDNYDVFEQLSLPSLTTLQVHYHRRDLGPELHRFISHSRPPLTHLHLDCTFSYEDALRTLALLPTITHFTLKNVWDTQPANKFLCRMTVTPESTNILLPNLMNLGLHFRIHIKISIQDVLKMVESRCRVTPNGVGQRLVFLRMTLGTSKSEQKLVQQRIDVLRDNGLDGEVMFEYDSD